MNQKRVLKEKERQQEIIRKDKERRRDFIKDVGTDNNNSQEEGETYQPSEKKKRTVILEIPRSVLASPEVCDMADRTQLSSRKLTGNVAAILKSAKKIVLDPEQKQYGLRTGESKLPENANQMKTKVDLRDFHLSENTARRQRNKNREQNYEEFVNNFVPPKHAAAHWDGKFCRDVLGSHNGVEYVSILLSGYPDMIEARLIEVADLANTKGETQASAVFDSLSNLKSEKNIRALVFDTTASNTGHIQVTFNSIVFYQLMKINC